MGADKLINKNPVRKEIMKGITITSKRKDRKRSQGRRIIEQGHFKHQFDAKIVCITYQRTIHKIM